MDRRNLRLACALAVLSVSLAATPSQAAVYTSDWLADLAGTPGTPGTAGTPASAGTVIRSFSGSVSGASPTFQRPDGSSSELTPNAPTSLASGLFNYQANSWVSTVAGTVDVFQATEYDGYLHVYRNAFNPATPLVNVIAGDDDMGELFGGTVPNRGGVGSNTTLDDSGVRLLNVTLGTTYIFVVSGFYNTVSSSAHTGPYFQELRTQTSTGTGGTPGVSPTAGRQGEPAQAIVEVSNPDDATIISLNVDSTEKVGLFNRLTLHDIEHPNTQDIVVRLRHAGITVTILDGIVGGAGDLFAGVNYQFTDGAVQPFPSYNPAGNYDYRSVGLLSAFVGTPVGGLWELLVYDDTNNGSGGTMCAFSIDISPLRGDYNNDGFVDAADYTVWADHFGQTGVGVAGDGNGDNVVDAADYTVWADNFGRGIRPPSVSSAVPEPTSLAGEALAALLLGRRRR